MMTERLEAVPPSAKLVYLVLDYNGVLTQQQITEKSRLPKRTVRDALDRLGERDIVSKERYIPDARQNTHRITGRICEENQAAVR